MYGRSSSSRSQAMRIEREAEREKSVRTGLGFEEAIL